MQLTVLDVTYVQHGKILTVWYENLSAAESRLCGEHGDTSSVSLNCVKDVDLSYDEEHNSADAPHHTIRQKYCYCYQAYITTY